MSARWARKTENGKKKQNVKEKARKMGEKLQKKGYITSVRLGSRKRERKDTTVREGSGRMATGKEDRCVRER